MIKSISLLTRKDGWTHEQFVKHWVEVHAPLAHAVPGLRRVDYPDAGHMLTLERAGAVASEMARLIGGQGAAVQLDRASSAGAGRAPG